MISAAGEVTIFDTQEKLSGRLEALREDDVTLPRLAASCFPVSAFHVEQREPALRDDPRLGPTRTKTSSCPASASKDHTSRSPLALIVPTSVAGKVAGVAFSALALTSFSPTSAKGPT